MQSLQVDALFWTLLCGAVRSRVSQVIRGKESSGQRRRPRRLGFDPWVRKIPWSTGRGTPLQYSCLENSLDRGAWGATVHGVTESDTTKRVHIYGLDRVQNLYFKPRMSGTKHRSSSDIAGTMVRFRVLNCKIKNVLLLCFLGIICAKTIMNLLQYSTI